jgi:AraC-like DNA-binding protein/mannose-6-phosphate isomerase-like protein (cupin superfamily)
MAKLATLFDMPDDTAARRWRAIAIFRRRMSIQRQTPADEPHFIVRSFSAVLRHDAQISPHHHAWPQLILAIHGVMTVWTQHGSWVVPPSWAILAPAHVQHSIRAHGETLIRTLYFRPDVGLSFATAPAVIGVTPLLRELTVAATEIGMLDERNETHRAIGHLLRYSMRSEAVAAFDLPMPSAEPLHSLAQRMLLDSSTQRASVATIAVSVAMSARTLERTFHTATGMPIGRWRRHAALIAALRLLAAGTPVKTVALTVGFCSPSAFIVAFRQMFGHTPAQYFSGRTS